AMCERKSGSRLSPGRRFCLSCAPHLPFGGPMLEQTLEIATKHGAMETFICHPERGGPYPAVLLLMDAPGIREELRDMARRLGTVGYYLLLLNLYYRAGRETVYGPDVLDNVSAEQLPMRAMCSKM